MSKSNKDERELLSPPGDTILETIEYQKMTQTELARRLGKTPSKVNDLITGKEPITVTTAMQLEKVLGIDTQFWLNRESLYREKLSRIQQEDFLQKCFDWVKEQPIKQLKAYGYLDSEKIDTNIVAKMLQFYAVDTPKEWEAIYINNYASPSFRKSTGHATALSSMAAWLRIGEIEMRNLNLEEYNKELFKANLQQSLRLVEEHPEDFAGQLQELSRQAGVAIVYTMSLPKAPISGAARWVGGQPLIQLTDRYKTNDQFWFTFFHEAGHILLHGKRDVFMEEFEGYETIDKKEMEADNFASDWLLPKTFIEDIPKVEITEKDVRKIARKYRTHPGIVLGRLQKLNLVSYSFGVEMKLKVVLDYYIKKSKQ